MYIKLTYYEFLYYWVFYKDLIYIINKNDHWNENKKPGDLFHKD